MFQFTTFIMADAAGAPVAEEVLDVLWDSDLERWLDDATAKAEVVRGCSHILLGDSVARDAGLNVAAPDLILKRPRGGDTWKKLADSIQKHVEMWQLAASSFGVPIGWMCNENLVHFEATTSISWLQNYIPSCSLTTKTHQKRRIFKTAAEGWSGPTPPVRRSGRVGMSGRTLGH